MALARVDTKRAKALLQTWSPTVPTPEPTSTYLTPPLFNADLSLLKFNQRVLAQAEDSTIPLMERVFFLSICASNLDEFFEIRMARSEQERSLLPGSTTSNTTTSNPRVNAQAQQLVKRQYQCLNQKIIPALAEAGIQICRPANFPDPAADLNSQYFAPESVPKLRIQRVLGTQPFPSVATRVLCFIVELAPENTAHAENRYAVIQCDGSLAKRPITAVEGNGGTKLIFTSDLVKHHIATAFQDETVLQCWAFRVTRDIGSKASPTAGRDLTISSKLFSSPNSRHIVRLELEETCPRHIRRILLTAHGVDESALFLIDGPLDLTRLGRLPGMFPASEFHFAPFIPRTHPAPAPMGMFLAMAQQDLVLHHPYESFDPVLRLLQQAAGDPQVESIKMTLYRTEPDSQVVRQLIRASLGGKNVSVVVELRARFDEAANARVAIRLQAAGAKVSFGVKGLKTHAKILLITRREGHKKKLYGHLSTGNYHAGTARLYTDIGLLTANREVCEDMDRVFRKLLGTTQNQPFNKLLVSPCTLGHELHKLIAFETAEAQAGRRGRIQAKMNSLSDAATIQSLYCASQAGVVIDLIVRGMCCLQPGVPGLSDNIRVRSIVGRFLEHSRLFYFHAAGEKKLYCTSADWMSRNLQRRIEVAFPIENKVARDRLLHESIELPLRDNTQAWQLASDGAYTRIQQGCHSKRTSQVELLEKLSSYSEPSA